MIFIAHTEAGHQHVEAMSAQINNNFVVGLGILAVLVIVVVAFRLLNSKPDKSDKDSK